MAEEFKRGDPVRKFTGDTHPEGVVLGSVTTSRGHVRVIVELNYENLLHIYAPEQLMLLRRIRE